MPKSPKFEIRTYSKDELARMFDACPDLRWQARLMSSVTAGLRKAEVLNLKVSDIDFAQGTLVVQSCRETDSTWQHSPKGYECRKLKLTERLANLFTRILADEIPAGQPYLMLSERRYWHLQQLRRQGIMPDRMRLSPDETFTRPFQRILQGASVADGTFHDLRRTCITSWSWSLPPQEVQRLAGHADIATTMEYYAAIRPDVLDRAAECSLL
jgi:integrase